MSRVRINMISYNIWNTERWARRESALRGFMQIFDPDLLCVQELRRKSQAFLDGVLAHHARVHDRFAGWSLESNIYWRASMFEEIEHGAEDVQIREAGHRRLFWVRLAVRALDRSILVGTAHLTHQRHPQESSTGVSPRIGEIQRIIAALRRLSLKREPVFFMGDLNDPVHATDHLHKAGYVSSFSALGLQPPPTFKCYPTANVAPGKLAMSQCIDWIVANKEARAIATVVPQFYLDDAAPSDHWPVQAVYEIEGRVTSHKS
ncbi:MAG: endonuclease/exonuclease/phosphatase family protein [Burkholderiales bacterium]